MRFICDRAFDKIDLNGNGKLDLVELQLGVYEVYNMVRTAPVDTQSLRLRCSCACVANGGCSGGGQVNKRFPGWCVRPPSIHQSPFTPALLISLFRDVTGVTRLRGQK
jgi:hypothetical protein